MICHGLRLLMVVGCINSGQINQIDSTSPLQTNDVKESIQRALGRGEVAYTLEDEFLIRNSPQATIEYVSSELSTPERMGDAFKLFSLLVASDGGLVSVDRRRLVASSIVLYCSDVWSDRSDVSGYAGQLLNLATKNASPPMGERSVAVIEDILEGISDRSSDPRSAYSEFQWILVGGASLEENVIPYLRRIMDSWWWKPRKAKVVEGKMSLERPDGFVSSPVWASLLASARVYKSYDIQTCIDLVDSSAKSDSQKFMTATMFLPYIGRPEVVDYFAGFLDSKDMRDSLTHDDSGPDTFVAMDAISQIEKMLPDFHDSTNQYMEAVRSGEIPYQGQQDLIAFCREWLADRDRWVPLLERP